jgi:hypothetical protein
MEPKTVVIFRKWSKKEGGGILALFPYEQASPRFCSSFEHIGQHGGADLLGCIQRTKLATQEEYTSLKRELESAPYRYRLEVRKRINWNKHNKTVNGGAR